MMGFKWSWISVKKWLGWLNNNFLKTYQFELTIAVSYIPDKISAGLCMNLLIYNKSKINHPSLWGIFPLFNFFHLRHISKILDNFRRKQNEALHWFINHPLFWLSWVQLNFDEIFWFLFLVPRVPSKRLQNESLASAEAYSIVSSSYPFYS